MEEITQDQINKVIQLMDEVKSRNYREFKIKMGDFELELKSEPQIEVLEESEKSTENKTETEDLNEIMLTDPEAYEEMIQERL